MSGYECTERKERETALQAGIQLSKDQPDVRYRVFVKGHIVWVRNWESK